MATMDTIRNRAADANDQIAQLREQVEALMNDRVTPALANFSGRAESMARSASDMAREQASAVTGKVREQPLFAVLIAGFAGFLIGRLFR
jgi:ElaB/YqjD/DUF883 family membrane-anchored ribosome-binding protein